MQKFLLGPVKHLPNPGGHVGLQTAVFFKKKNKKFKIANAIMQQLIINRKDEYNKSQYITVQGVFGKGVTQLMTFKKKPSEKK